MWTHIYKTHMMCHGILCLMWFVFDFLLIKGYKDDFVVEISELMSKVIKKSKVLTTLKHNGVVTTTFFLAKARSIHFIQNHGV